MTEAEFRALAAQGYNRIPLVLESFADLDTPLSLYLKLANQRYTYPARIGRRRRALRALLVHRPAGESPHPRARTRDRGRGSTAASSSATTAIRWRSSASSCAAIAPRRGPGCRASAAASPATSATTPCATSRRGSPVTRPPPTPALADVPDILLLLTEELAVVDNLSGKISLIVYADPARAECLLRRRATRLQELRRKLREPVAIPYQTATDGHARRERIRRRGATRPRCARSREYIAAGDIMQVVLSQRMQRPFTAPPLSLYRALRSLNPSPYMFYYDFGDFHVVGASPEILVRKEGATITLRPIAGTRPRGATREADEALAHGAARRSEGDRRARDAARSRPQRRRPRRADRHACRSPTAW